MTFRSSVCAAVLLALSAAALPAQDLMTIQAAIEDRNGDTIPDRLGQKIHVRGVVTIGSGVVAGDRLQVYFQDDTAGMYLFSRDRGAAPMRAGDVIEVTGELDQYRGSPQITRPRYRVVGRAAIPAAKRVPVSDAASWKEHGKLVEVEGVLSQPTEEGPNIAARLRGAGGEIKLLFPRAMIGRMSFSSMPPGTTVRAQGVASIYSLALPHREGFRLIVADATWVRVVRRPMPAWVKTAATSAAAAVLLALLAWLLARAWRQRAGGRDRHVAVLNTLSGAIATRMGDVDTLLTDAIAVLSRFGVLDGAVVHLVEGNRLRLQGAFGVDAEQARAIDQQVQARIGANESDASPTPFDGRTTLSLPLHGRSRTVGILTAVRSKRSMPQEASLLGAAANLIALGIENIQMMEQAEQRQAELKELAITDPLTGLYNRRFLDEYLRIHLPMARRQSAPVSFIAIDLDHFKRVNDEYGHAAGDALLAEVGKTIRRATRASDLPVRTGGEEFLVVMPDTDEGGAVAFAARLQSELRSAQIPVGDERIPVRITASCGIAIYPDHGENIRQLTRVVDEALYASKRDGRDRITIAPAPFRLSEEETAS